MVNVAISPNKVAMYAIQAIWLISILLLMSLFENTIIFVAGEIRTVLALDREEAALYHLEVEAVDGGVPRLTCTAMLEVRVLDENDNAPEVIQPLQEVITVREKQPPGESH